ncbi:thiamine-phosphate pyrophosphorylase [Syntrophus gentianae]|uniref:Thiamine-phosphate synthase n=1 Tax=Syntrophus gentianae TaxID=43775 RepID=A0A1H7YBQ1_9BACT|nr:thiamine phosphate synthase [Syntrophus gentianae]SEM43294.1 thiamine-phosphate pyrophosphorylase [Syntrophus gentianae]
MSTVNTRSLKDRSLYLVLTEEYGNGRSLREIAAEAVAGGIDLLQMREKSKSREELLRLGGDLAALCRRNGVTFIVNDDPLLAAELDADGVHLGQEDLQRCPVDRAREILGRDRIIGISTHSVEQFRRASGLDADYLAFGPIFPTRTKDYSIGTAEIREVLRLATKPVVFIGGVNPANFEILRKEGVTFVALIRDIMQAQDIAARAGWYKEQLKKAGGTRR